MIEECDFILNVRKLQKAVKQKVFKIATNTNARAVLIRDTTPLYFEKLREQYNAIEFETLEEKTSYLKERFLHHHYIEFFLGDGKSYTGFGKGACTNFLEYDFDLVDRINQNTRWDFFSVYLGFEGWHDAVKHGFDIEKIDTFKQEEHKNKKISNSEFREEEAKKDLLDQKKRLHQIIELHRIPRWFHGLYFITGRDEKDDIGDPRYDSSLLEITSEHVTLHYKWHGEEEQLTSEVFTELFDYDRKVAFKIRSEKPKYIYWNGRIPLKNKSEDPILEGRLNENSETRVNSMREYAFFMVKIHDRNLTYLLKEDVTGRNLSEPNFRKKTQKIFEPNMMELIIDRIQQSPPNNFHKEESGI